MCMSYKHLKTVSTLNKQYNSNTSNYVGLMTCSCAATVILPCSFSTVPSGTPQSIQAQPIDSRSLLLAWEPPLVQEQNGVIQEYLINISVVETGDEFQYRSTNTTLIVEDLHPHYIYSLVISAVTISPGPYSEVYTVQMPEDGRSLGCIMLCT